MRFDILTLFPQAFDSFKNTSIIGRAVEAGLIEVNTYDIRDFASNKHRSVDDVPYGGGAGMVMSCQPLFDAIAHVKALVNDNAPVIYFTAHGAPFCQEVAEQAAKGKLSITNYELQNNSNNSSLVKGGGLTSEASGDLAINHSPSTICQRLILLCGHYEGIDQRIRDNLVDQEICLGPYILTGGELPAQVFIDSVARLLPGVIGKEASHQEESFSEILGRNTVEYPHYTRPEVFNGWSVPEVLLSGHHAEIEKWRKAQCKPQNL